jgi:hypothetical protein
MTTSADYKLHDKTRTGGILIDPENGTPDQLVAELKSRYGERLLSVIVAGQLVFESQGVAV